jgi:DNA modification methylase
MIEINKYHVGDSREMLASVDDSSVDLVYIDPPYATGRNFGDFCDKFDSKKEYINQLMQPVFTQVKRILKPSGNVVVHCDPTVSHYIRITMDEVFGENKFMNEIAWKSGGNAKNKSKLGRYHDTIIVYCKNKAKAKFNPIYMPYNEEYKSNNTVKFCEIHNKEYVTTAIHNSQPDVNPRMNLRYEWNGHHKQWYVSSEKMQSLHNDNRLKYNSKGIPRIKRFLVEMEGLPVRDLWTDINQIQSGEKMDYATQKPIKLLDRIINLYTDKGDLVLDAFAGSGTTGRSAIRCERNFILFDISKKGKDLFDYSVDIHKE